MGLYAWFDLFKKLGKGERTKGRTIGEISKSAQGQFQTLKHDACMTQM